MDVGWGLEIDSSIKETALQLMLVMFICLLGVAVHEMAADASSPSDNLVAVGIPPISPDLVARAHPYTELRSAAFVAWRPAHREILIATRLGPSAQIYR